MIDEINSIVNLARINIHLGGITVDVKGSKVQHYSCPLITLAKAATLT